MYTFVAVNPSEPYGELFIWAVFFRRMSLAQMFWKQCPNKLGSALIASSLLRSLADEAKSAGKLQLAEELNHNSVLVSFISMFSLDSGPLVRRSAVPKVHYSEACVPKLVLYKLGRSLLYICNWH